MSIGRGMKKASDDDLCERYSRLGSVWAVAKEVGMCGQSVHERLVRIGKIKAMNVFTEADREYLELNYEAYRDKGELDKLAKKMGRSKQFMCRQAKRLGLTDQRKARPYAERAGSNPYAKLHARVRSLRGSPHKCEVCGQDNPRKWYEWANLTGKYEDPSDYKRMCRHCHKAYDKKRGEPALAHK